MILNFDLREDQPAHTYTRSAKKEEIVAFSHCYFYNLKYIPQSPVCELDYTSLDSKRSFFAVSRLIV